MLLNWNWAHSGGDFKEGQCTRFSLVDDWRHCCRCSWLKKRGAASMGRGQAVFPQKTVQTFPFHLMLNICLDRSESSYFTFNALNFLLTMSLSLTPFFIFHHLCSIGCSKARMGNLPFDPVHAWQMYEHVIYMMNWPFEGWHMVITLAWGNKIFYSCSNSTIEISWVLTIISPVSPEFKMFQQGLAQMQNRAYILKAGSNLFKRDKR